MLDLTNVRPTPTPKSTFTLLLVPRCQWRAGHMLELCAALRGVSGLSGAVDEKRRTERRRRSSREERLAE